MEGKSEMNSAVSVVEEHQDLVKKLPMKKNTKSTITMVLTAFLVVSAGLATGWVLAGNQPSTGSKGSSDSVVSVSKNDNKNLKEAGVEDDEAFPDSAEGILLEGGIDGEGTHHLDRDLGETKFVYLNSTVINLDNFVGKKVMVWGQTVTAQKAGWLMDVGRVKVTE